MNKNKARTGNCTIDVTIPTGFQHKEKGIGTQLKELSDAICGIMEKIGNGEVNDRLIDLVNSTSSRGDTNITTAIMQDQDSNVYLELTFKIEGCTITQMTMIHNQLIQFIEEHCDIADTGSAFVPYDYMGCYIDPASF